MPEGASTQFAERRSRGGNTERLSGPNGSIGNGRRWLHATNLKYLKGTNLGSVIFKIIINNELRKNSMNGTGGAVTYDRYFSCRPKIYTPRLPGIHPARLEVMSPRAFRLHGPEAEFSGPRDLGRPKIHCIFSILQAPSIGRWILRPWVRWRPLRSFDPSRMGGPPGHPPSAPPCVARFPPPR